MSTSAFRSQSRHFRLADLVDFQDRTRAQVPVQAMQDYVFVTKYARWNASQGRRETFEEAVDRVMDMHQRRYGTVPGITAEIDFVRTAMKERLVLGSQRAMQNGGKPIEEKEARLYNCTVSYCDRPRFFQESEWLLLCGCGVGFSVQHHHVDRLPPIRRPSGAPTTVAIADTIEGWSDAIGALVSSYFTADQPQPGLAGRPVAFDYSAIRPKGSALKSGIAKAPGPDPLRRALESIRGVLDRRLAQAGDGCRLRAIDAYDMIMHGSDAVISGGTRRSATICLFSPDDQEMVTAKTGDWMAANPQRARSNNSALLLRDGEGATSREQFTALMDKVKQFGEPGFVWADNRDILFNPCVEIGMYPVDTATGKSGWAFCNLCCVNMKACRDEQTFERAVKAAAIVGTLQAGYTNVPYLGETTESIIRREALLGCSMTGMMDNPGLALDPSLQQRMAKTILAENARIAELIGINPASRATCVKPEGTTSLILGTSSGIHPHHAEAFIRRVQANDSELPLQYFRAHNPQAVSKSVWNPNGVDVVVSFPVTVSADAATKAQVGALDLLKEVVKTQDNWVAAGKRPGSPPWLSHNVSNTITVRDGEWDAVTDFIYANRKHLAGVSLLPESGDLDYPQAPFLAVKSPSEITKEFGVGALLAGGVIEEAGKAFGQDLWSACDVVLGRRSLESGPRNEAQTAWVERARQFARDYFKGDERAMTYCLKRVSAAKEFSDLSRTFTPVDWTLMPESMDTTKAVEQDSACAGGKCEIVHT